MADLEPLMADLEQQEALMADLQQQEALMADLELQEAIVADLEQQEAQVADFPGEQFTELAARPWEQSGARQLRKEPELELIENAVVPCLPDLMAASCFRRPMENASADDRQRDEVTAAQIDYRASTS